MSLKSNVKDKNGVCVCLAGHAVQHSVGMDANVQLSDGGRSGPCQEPVEDQHVAAAGRHDSGVRRHRPPDVVLRTPHPRSRAGG